jgi:hypothetical protein
MKLSFVFALSALAAWPVCAQAEHATIDLRVIRLKTADQGQTEVHASADTEPPVGGNTPRPLFKVKAKEPLVLQFVLTNNYPHGIRKGVTVRYFVVREKKLRQKEIPPFRGAVIQGKFKLNFKPKCRVGGRFVFRLPEAGVYLVRIDTLNTQSDHEHFSAIDLQAK